MERNVLKKWNNQKVIVKGIIDKVNLDNNSYCLRNVIVTLYGSNQFETIDHLWIFPKNEIMDKKKNDLYTMIGLVHNYFRKSIGEYDYGIKHLHSSTEEQYYLIITVNIFEYIKSDCKDIKKILEKYCYSDSKFPSAVRKHLLYFYKKICKYLYKETYCIDGTIYTVKDFLDLLRIKIRKKEILLFPGDEFDKDIYLSYSDAIKCIDDLKQTYCKFVEFSKLLKKMCMYDIEQNVNHSFSSKVIVNKISKPRRVKGF